ncbi:4-amino-4-deoxy-L-arabinose transferase [Abditibacterium utsteinense]|uniref:4-amino-4-deoxy-L-arabinose transferase n=1 Tax=Abditibacterium utsteinense TaxID=1960156 RepID=A0A2S8SSH5_9BACT|nr:glycosyltransferase family 39 protein [Abditibacterium utsteinense]PQV63751.1 4-amino-4-deoxy-L-arabinose transferase [Abditibacterium utsteinense]
MSARFSQFVRSRHGATLALVFLSFLTLFFGIWSLPFVGSDEPRYAEVAREMWANSDYISPKLAGRLWLEKAPLLYWGQALFYSLFGVNEMSARLPSALGALCIVLGLRGVARRAFGARAALYVGIVAATTGMMIYLSHGASTDMPLCSMFTGAFLCLWRSAYSEKRSFAWMMACAAFVGGAMLAKGLIGPLLFIVIGGVWWFWARPDLRANFASNPQKITASKTPAQRLMIFAAALLVFFGVSAIWYAPVWIRHGQFFWQEFFVNQHFKRFTSNEYKHPQEPTFYLAILPLCALPWTLWLIGAARGFRALRPKLSQRDSFLALAWVWAIVPIAFFSVSESKLPSYILPSFPAIAILAGEALSRGVFVPRAWKPKWVALAGASFMVCLVLGAFLLYAPKAENKLSTRSLCRVVAAQMRPEERATFLDLGKDYDPHFYLQGRVVAGLGKPGTGSRDTFVAATPAEFLPILKGEKSGSLIVFCRNSEAQAMEHNSAFSAQFLGKHPKYRAYRIEAR